MARLSEFKQYDTIKIVRMLRPTGAIVSPSQRAPQPGDIAAIVDVYDSPLGYELECSEPSTGVTIWLESFSADDLEVERYIPGTV